MLRPSTLLRLYPSLWRLKYGQEFLAMLESTEPSWQRSRDVARAAAWEWVRWTHVGRTLLAFALGTAAMLCAVAIHTLAPGWDFLRSLRSLQGWTDLCVSMLVITLPFLVATAVAFAARSARTGPSRPGFRGQLAILFACAVYAALLRSASDPMTLTVSGFVKGSLGNGFFIAYSLWIIFNIERAGTWRRRFSIEP